MLSLFFSSPWFALLVLVFSAAALGFPVLRVHQKMRQGQAARESQALAQAQSAMEAWRAQARSKSNSPPA